MIFASKERIRFSFNTNLNIKQESFPQNLILKLQVFSQINALLVLEI